jgi:choline kinase
MSLLERSVQSLQQIGIKRIAIVTGFRSDLIERDFAAKATIIHNPFYAECNNMGSLWIARNWVAGDAFLYLHADLIYDFDLLAQMIQGNDNSPLGLLVDFNSVDEEAMKVRVDGEDMLIESHKGIPLDIADGEWVGITRATQEGSKLLFEEIENLLMDGHLQDYDTLAFTRLAQRGIKISTIPTSGRRWVEIDFLEDLMRAREMWGDE